MPDNRTLGQRIEDRKIQGRDAGALMPSPGLFSVDARLPDQWNRSVQEQQATYNDIRTGQLGQPTQVDSRGIPVNWDYKTSKIGPWGEPLPQKATGWRPTGEPDFGPGIPGWWNRTINNIYEDREDEDSPSVAEILQNLFDSIGQSHAKRDQVIKAGGDEKAVGEAELGVLGTAALGTVGAAVEILKTSWSSLEGDKVNPLTAIPRVIGETFRTAGDLLQGAAEYAEEEVFGARILADVELGLKYDILTQEDLEKWDGWLGQLAVFPTWARVGTAMLTGDIPKDEYYAMSKEFRNETAAKIAYTAWKDVAVKGEYVRRIRAGEDPRLLALELEDPVDEMVLEFIFDPLNVFDLWYTGVKALTAGGRLASKLNRGRLAVELADSISDINKAIDVGNIAEMNRAIEVVGPVIDNAVQGLLRGEVKAATARGVFKLQQSFNQYDRAEDFANMFGDILRATNADLDLMGDVGQAMVLIIDPDNEKKLAGFAKLNAIIGQTGGVLDPDLLFSDTGVRSMILFRDLITDRAGNITASKLENIWAMSYEIHDNTGKIIREATKKKPIDAAAELAEGERLFRNPEKVALQLSEHIADVTKRRFPVIQDAIKQADELIQIEKDFGKGSDEAIAYLRKNPAAGQKISPLMRRVTPLHDVIQKGFYKPAANIQSKVFMGLNPAYMYRNRVGNSMALLADRGPQAFFRGMAPRVLKGRQGAIDTVDNWVGFLPKGLERTQAGAHASFTLGDDAVSWGPILKTAQQDEQLARLHVAAKIIPETVRQQLHPRRALEGIAGVLLSKEDQRLFVRLSKSNYGDLKSTWKAFKEHSGTQVARTLDGISDGDMYFIEKMGLDDDLWKILKDPELGQEQIVRQLEDLLDDWGEYGLEAAMEAGLLDLEDIDDAVEALDELKIMEGFYGPEVAKLRGREFYQKLVANDAYVEAAKSEAKAAFRTLEKQLKQDLVNDAQQARDAQIAAGQVAKANPQEAGFYVDNIINQLEDEAFGVADKLHKNAKRQHIKHLERVRKHTKNIESYDTAKLVRLYEGELKFYGKSLKDIFGPVSPDDITQESFMDMMWDTYRNTVSDSYNHATAQSVRVLQDNADALLFYTKGVGEEIAGETRTFDKLTGLRQETDKRGVVATLMNKAEVDETGRTVVKVTKDELNNLLPELYRQALARSVDALEDNPEAILDNLAEIGEALAEDPTRRIDDIIEELGMEDTRAALVQLSGPRWRETARFMIDEGEEVAEVVEEGAPLLDEIGELLKAAEEGVEEVAEATHTIPVVGAADGGGVSPPRFFHETYPAAEDVVRRLIKTVKENFDGGIESRIIDDATEARFKEWLPDARKRVNRVRTEASKQAIKAGDFAMHNYGKRYGMDVFLSYLFPYQFWYSRSYMKWMQRAVRHPGLAAAYFRYRDTLAKEHAGLPDWWKYQVNTNELLGRDDQEPIWFNLESLVNPLNGITGVDFTDPKRRVDNWGAAMEDISKFGPTPWAPYQLALMTYYKVTGEDEASARWAGRILPFSKSIRDVTALADPKGLGIEVDPYVHLFGGGIEAYERGRVGRQIGRMMDEGEYSKADIIDATYNQEGDIWDTARARTINERSPNVAFALAPFMFGAGAKPRNVQDQTIDQMYGQMDGLIKNRENMGADEYRTAWQQLRQQYPFMDVVLMSKKAGLERDEALAWNTLSRIPPGATKSIAEEVGIQRKDLDAFYENKGDLTTMTEAERMRFMAAVLDIGGLLDIPEQATQAEWQASKNLYKQMRSAGEEQFGADIWDMVDIYYASRDPDDPDVGRDFLRTNPMVSDALDWQQVMIQNTPLLAAYYTSEERIRQFYKTQMYQTAEELFGKDLWDNFEIYSRLKDLGEDKAAREFWKATPGLSGYMQLKEDTLPTIDEKVDHFGSLIPEAKPPKYRHEEYDITPMAPISDDREASITAQVSAYAEAYSDYSGQRTDIRELIRAEADKIWPNTRAPANTYYDMLSGGDAGGAASYLSEQEELQARVMWEFDKIQRLDLAALGELFQSAGAAPGLEEPLAAPPGIDPNTPLGRLYNDPQGIPEHLWQAYLQYGQQ